MTSSFENGTNDPVQNRVTTQYPQELKAEAILRFKKGERKVVIASQLGVPQPTLRGWLRGCGKDMKNIAQPKKRLRDDSAGDGDKELCHVQARKRTRVESVKSRVEVNSCQVQSSTETRKESTDSGIKVGPCHNDNVERSEPLTQSEFAERLGLIGIEDLKRLNSVPVKKIRRSFRIVPVSNR